MNRRLFLACCGVALAALVFAQTDTVAPQLVCQNSVQWPLGYECNRWVIPSDLILSLSDNLTDSADLQTGIRKVCTGNGFPENSPYFGVQGGESILQIAEIWARDLAGNTASALCSLIVWDSYHYCDSGLLIITDMPDSTGIAQATIMVDGGHCYFDSIHHQYQTTQQQTYLGYGGVFQMGTLAPAAGYNLTVTPTKDLNPLNGISTFDLVLIQKHVMGIEPLDSPYKIIAADANQDGQVTIFDVLLLKQLLLGLTTELPNSRSWRFVPQDYVFPNPATPSVPPFPERIEVLSSDPEYAGPKLFYGVKIGDVNYSANPGQ